MIGVLTALPGTQLTRRLEKEGRLRIVTTGDQFDRPNFQTTMDERTLLSGYAGLLADLYDAVACPEDPRHGRILCIQPVR